VQFNAEAADRYQEAMGLKKELALKDIKISELEASRSELRSQSKSLNQEVEHLQSEIRALKVRPLSPVLTFVCLTAEDVSRQEAS